MAISQETLGRRLREARIARGITQEAAGEAIGLPRTAIVHFEAGNRVPSTLQLAKLAEFYKYPIADFFSENETAENAEEQVLVSLRVDPQFQNNPQLQHEITRCVDLCHEAVALEQILGWTDRDMPPCYKLSEPKSRAEAASQGAQVAKDERRRLGLADGPIHVLADLISNQGLWVSGAELPNEMSGLFLHHPSIGMAILVNRKHARPRKRFSFAHEYGHAVMDQNRSAIVSTSQNARDFGETRANSFAATLLMPEGGVRSFLSSLDKGSTVRQTQVVYNNAGRQGTEAQTRAVSGSQKITYQDVAALSRYFGVSYQAAVYRLQDLGVINQTEKQSLLDQETQGNDYLRLLHFPDAVDDGQMSDETSKGHQDLELVERIVYLAIEAFRREEITAERLLDLADKLEIPGPKLVELAESARQ
jgi:Zn-dependent peptidase ImmA (M78 family)/transcriptional regulator with XRE-family HTH domain